MMAPLKGWLIGYLLAGPRRDPVVEAEIAFLMGIWRMGEAMRRLMPTVEEATRAFEAFGVILKAADEQ